MTQGIFTRRSFSPQDYELFRGFLQEACGILLGENKQYLVTSRLNKIMAQHNLATLSDLVQQIKRNPHSGLRERVIDAMTTNETLWFRDIHPFNILEQKVLPELAARNDTAGPLRIWSAACSSGQEPYSISMVLDAFKQKRFGAFRAGEQIMATDISASMLEVARKGEYEMLALARGLPKEKLQVYFTQAGDGRWLIKPQIQRRVEFRQLNLLNSYSGLGKFDVIFCRNVLIYFSAELKRDILKRMHAALKPGGYLFLGASEALSNMPQHYEMVQCHPGIIYRAK